jgi:UDP-N-acetyl-D-galactosamine dehydrogenase
MRKIAVLGLGYVGLPVAVAFAEHFPGTIGFDIDTRRIASLRGGEDWTGEIGGNRLKASGLVVTSELSQLKNCDTFIVCVPTPIHKDRRPNLEPLRSASESVGQMMRKGALVIYESTVYPGVTEEYCGPILARVSGLKQGRDFKLGYSPERINPGDKEHSFERILKVTSGEDAETAETVAELYGTVVTAGIHRASSIKVAEAAKALENTQRDLNIALMNEMAIICDVLKIPTRDVIEAAATKWNFLKFTPGLVGGHCIGVDPYYLTSKAQELGYNPQVILAGRRINDSMGKELARFI